MTNIFHYEFTIPSSAIDVNGHVNNVMYVQWMQDAAVAHSNSVGDTVERQRKEGVMWVARSHHIDYLRQAFEGDTIVVETWAESFKKTSSQREYRFIRKSDNTLLAKANTVWVYLKKENGRPIAIEEEVMKLYM